MALWSQGDSNSSWKNTVRWRNFPTLWLLCAVAAASFAACFVLHIASADNAVKFSFALMSLSATCAVQRFSLLEIVVELSWRRQVLASLVLESALR